MEKDVSKTFMSRVVEDAVNNAAEIIALPRSQVLPVKNYEKETTLNTDINILALTALRKSLVFADDFLENQYDWQQDNMQILNKRDWVFQTIGLILTKWDCIVWNSIVHLVSFQFANQYHQLPKIVNIWIWTLNKGSWSHNIE